MPSRRALIDTSVLIAQETGRSIDVHLLPDESLISVITIAELQAGVLSADTTDLRSRRLATLTRISHIRALPVDVATAERWAALRTNLRSMGRRANINDLWIAAIALANGLPVVSQDGDFDVIAACGGPELIKV